MRIQVVIPNLLATEYHLSLSVRCIEEARAKTKLPFELIIIENSNIPMLEEYGDYYEHYKEKRSYSLNVNSGLRLCDSEYVVILSNDVFVPDGWLEALIEPFEKYKDCGISTLESSQFNVPCKNEIVDGFFGAIWCVSGKALKDIGLLDEEFYNSFEDADYWMRCMKAGYELKKNCKVMVNHLVGQTSYNVAKHKENYIKNRTRFNEKHIDVYDGSESAISRLFSCLR